MDQKMLRPVYLNRKLLLENFESGTLEKAIVETPELGDISCGRTLLSNKEEFARGLEEVIDLELFKVIFKYMDNKPYILAQRSKNAHYDFVKWILENTDTNHYHQNRHFTEYMGLIGFHHFKKYLKTVDDYMMNHAIRGSAWWRIEYFFEIGYKISKKTCHFSCGVDMNVDQKNTAKIMIENGFVVKGDFFPDLEKNGVDLQKCRIAKVENLLKTLDAASRRKILKNLINDF